MRIKIVCIFLCKLRIVATNLSIAFWGDDTFQDWTESDLSKLEIETPILGKQNTHPFLFMFLERIQNIFNIKYIINNIRGI